MLIVLLGYMGSGKSTVGRVLAERLNLPFTDLDEYIESAIGASIPEIFREKGELFFRKKEHELLVSLLDSGKPGVLSLGGGTPAYAGNMDRVLKATPNSFYLQHSIPSLVDRLISEKAQRPLIAHLPDSELPEFIGKHLFDRGPYYLQATHTLASSGKTPEELVAEIEGKLV
ncbi:MAG: shikimate kinase [Robiginitalea sp.]|uniref:shikimate kinase n=1 Tax=Robiginitalea sp. TaxID=1902411 RepID=UPI003C70C23E